MNAVDYLGFGLGGVGEQHNLYPFQTDFTRWHPLNSQWFNGQNSARKHRWTPMNFSSNLSDWTPMKIIQPRMLAYENSSKSRNISVRASYSVQCVYICVSAYVCVWVCVRVCVHACVRACARGKRMNFDCSPLKFIGFFIGVHREAFQTGIFSENHRWTQMNSRLTRWVTFCSKVHRRWFSDRRISTGAPGWTRWNSSSLKGVLVCKCENFLFLMLSGGGGGSAPWYASKWMYQ